MIYNIFPNDTLLLFSLINQYLISIIVYTIKSSNKNDLKVNKFC